MLVFYPSVIAVNYLIMDIGSRLFLASFVAIFTIIYFMPEEPIIVYPICGASILSSFGCIYLERKFRQR